MIGVGGMLALVPMARTELWLCARGSIAVFRSKWSVRSMPRTRMVVARHSTRKLSVCWRPWEGDGLQGQDLAAGLAVLGRAFTGVLALAAVVVAMGGSGRIEANNTIGIRIPPLPRGDAAWQADYAAALMPAVVCGAIALILCVAGIFDLSVFRGALGGIVWLLFRAVQAVNGSLLHYSSISDGMPL